MTCCRTKSGRMQGPLPMAADVDQTRGRSAECDQFQTKKRMIALSRTLGHQTRILAGISGNIGSDLREQRPHGTVWLGAPPAAVGTLARWGAAGVMSANPARRAPLFGKPASCLPCPAFAEIRLFFSKTIPDRIVVGRLAGPHEPGKRLPPRAAFL